MQAPVHPLVLVIALTSALACAANPPLIFIPGLTASDLAFELTNFSSVFPWCPRNEAWSDVMFMKFIAQAGFMAR